MTPKSVLFKVTSQKSKKTTQRNHKTIKWTSHIISWHTFYSPFQVLIYLECNNVRSGISRSNQHIPDSSTRFWHRPGKQASLAQKHSLAARQAAPGSPAHSTLPPNSHLLRNPLCAPTTGAMRQPLVRNVPVTVCPRDHWWFHEGLQHGALKNTASYKGLIFLTCSPL